MMLGFAVILTLFTQTMDNSIEADRTLFATMKLCREEGERRVGFQLETKRGSGKQVRSAWFSCDPVRGRSRARASR